MPFENMNKKITIEVKTMIIYREKNHLFRQSAYSSHKRQ